MFQSTMQLSGTQKVICPLVQVTYICICVYAHSIHVKMSPKKLIYAQVHNIGAGRQAADLARMLQELLLALASEIEHCKVTMMFVPQAALVQDCGAEVPLRVWGAIADKQVCHLRPCVTSYSSFVDSEKATTLATKQSLADFAWQSGLL